MASQRARSLFGLILAFALSAGAERALNAATYTITAMPDLTFSPPDLLLQVGDVVVWKNGGGVHNVVADDGSFRCARGCDGRGGNGDPSGENWSFSFQIGAPGAYGFHCETHGGAGTGMSGILKVEEPSAGFVQFSMPTFVAAEGDSASVRVVRTGNGAGAVTVDYATADDAATAGQDYLAASGTLSWADGDVAERTISIPLLTDQVVEGSEAFRISLSNPTGGAGIGSPGLATIVIGEASQGPPPPPPGVLAPTAVLCDSRRLTGFLERTRVALPRSTKTPSLSLSFSATGDFAGIATSGNAAGSPEKALAFSTNPEETTLLRNPERPQLFSVSATRNDLNSDAVAAGSPDEIRLLINPTLELQDPLPANLLALDNLAGAPGKPADAKPGRGLGPLLTPCHGPFSARDVHVFRVLSKIVRVDVPAAKSVEIAIYRDSALDSYRLDAYAYDASGASLGRLSATLEVTTTPAGDLNQGMLRMEDRCAVGQTNDCTSLTVAGSLELIKPRASGQALASSYRVSTAGPADVGVDFADLLGGTTWRRPLS